MNTEQKLLKKPEKALSDLYLLSSPLDKKDSIVIDSKDIILYGLCPRLYYVKSKYDKTFINLRDLYDKSLHNTIYTYLLALQRDELTDTLRLLKYQWGKEWIKYKNTRELVTSIGSLIIRRTISNRDSYEDRRQRGIDAIFKFNDLMIKDKQCPIIINHKYEVPILPNIILTGRFEYVREITDKNNKKIFQVVKFLSEKDSSYAQRTNVSIKYNMDLIAMSYAFSELFNVDYFESVLIDIEREKIYTNIYGPKEYNLLKQSIKGIATCIYNNINYMIPGDKCYVCNYRKVCMDNI